jgi:hypothetical protein
MCPLITHCCRYFTPTTNSKWFSSLLVAVSRKAAGLAVRKKKNFSIKIM